MKISTTSFGDMVAMMKPVESRPASVAAVAALDDRVRRGLFEAVRDAGRPLTRDEAANAVGISRKLAAFHLDKLVAVGLLTSGIAARTARRVGRAPKVYQPVRETIDVSIPPRAYADLASIMVEAVAGQQHGETASEAGYRIAAQRGRAAGADAVRGVRGRLGVERALALTCDALSAEGYAPYEAPDPATSRRPEDRAIRLRNCPFHLLAEQSPELVCRINGAFLNGLLEGLRAEPLAVQPTPPEGECCAEIRVRAAVRNNGGHDRGGG
jgi:predicted ArsR family transcriptional regulator